MSPPKFLCPLVKLWRGCGHISLVHPDDTAGIRGVTCLNCPESLNSILFPKTLLRPVSHLTMMYRFTSLYRSLFFLKTVLDFEKGLTLIPEGRIVKLKSSLVSCLQKVQ